MRRREVVALVEQLAEPARLAELVPGVTAVATPGTLGRQHARVVEAAQKGLLHTEDVRGLAGGVGGAVLVVEVVQVHR
ncbi:hypothetical protein BAY59_13585 [Prauserella coralliicola]|nr:hypothetical protein BAY59_13585 [Prauserella coralliicola]